MKGTIKTALVTGANKGIGYEIAKQLGKKGYFIILTARNEERGKKAFGNLLQLGISGGFVQMDVSNPKHIKTAFDEVKNHIETLDILVNNAGILLDESYPILDVPPEAVQQTFQINTFGALWTTQTFLPLMNKGSRIIMLSSSAGAFCGNLSNWAPIYSASKTAMNAITRQLHADLKGKGILINAMCPGWVRTDMGGSGATRSLEKGAETAVWLATEADEQVNGQFLRDKKVIDW